MSSEPKHQLQEHCLDQVIRFLDILQRGENVPMGRILQLGFNWGRASELIYVNEDHREFWWRDFETHFIQGDYEYLIQKAKALKETL